MDKAGKISALKRFREVEIKAAYLDIDGKDIKAVRALLDETKAARDRQSRTGSLKSVKEQELVDTVGEKPNRP